MTGLSFSRAALTNFEAVGPKVEDDDKVDRVLKWAFEKSIRIMIESVCKNRLEFVLSEYVAGHGARYCSMWYTCFELCDHYDNIE